ncbi:MAG: OsmC family protein [Candidatus Bipolaricaulia bacterium]
MPNVNLTGNRGLRFVAQTDSGHAVATDTDPDVGGLASAASPVELLLSGVAGCTAMDVMSILTKKRVQVDDLEIETDAEMESEPPKHLKSIHLVYKVWGPNVTEEALERAIELSQEKYCTVSNTVNGVATITWEHRINPQE